MSKRLLIANRGEIACRIIKTAKALGMTTIAVYSDIDKNALHVQMADEALEIGPAPSKESYLNQNAIIEAAKKGRADAIHPGYGFLSENADFAERCEQEKIIFVGPKASSIRTMGLKSTAKNLLSKAGIPVIPGYSGDDQSLVVLQKAAMEIGFPLLIKPSAGGGGKGMQIVHRIEDFDSILEASKREANHSFQDDRVILEKYLENPKHIEIQILADKAGNTIHLFDRDCSLQRRYQKIIEEAPSAIDDILREKLGNLAILIAKEIHYESTGTVEFLVDSQQNHYFMEMNTRLQVEHPVTEMITGINLVEWQLRVAFGENLPFTQEQIKLKGHAIEARIYAENPYQDFLPSTGKLSFVQLPENSSDIRVDSGIKEHDTIQIYYDPLLAKIIVLAENRENAILKLQETLNKTHLLGIKHNLPFLRSLVELPDFNRSGLATNYIDCHPDILPPLQAPSKMILFAAVLFWIEHRNQLANDKTKNAIDPNSPWHQVNHWRLNHEPPETIYLQNTELKEDVILKIRRFYREKEASSDIKDEGHFSLLHHIEFSDGACLLGSSKRLTSNEWILNLQVSEDPSATKYQQEHFFVNISHSNLYLYHNRQEYHFTLGQEKSNIITLLETERDLCAPMPGIISKILLTSNSLVKKGDPILILEAMKMEHIIRAPFSGKIIHIHFDVGSTIDAGSNLITLEPENAISK